MISACPHFGDRRHSKKTFQRDHKIMSTERILIIEDDPTIREVLEMLLQARGFQTVSAGNGELGLKRIEEKDPDLVLLDLTLPGMDGLEVCRRIRELPGKAKLPVIMLTARSEESDVVVGLEMGAVDYVTKPFNNQMLIARIRAQLRRTKELETAALPEKILLAENENEPEPEEELLSCHGVTLNLTQRTADFNEMPLELTFTEFELLAIFIRRPGRVWSRTDIAFKLRGDDYLSMDRSIDVQVANLRKKLGEAGKFIETVRGVGYRWKY